jgi:hypothetical protein
MRYWQNYATARAKTQKGHDVNIDDDDDADHQLD